MRKTIQLVLVVLLILISWTTVSAQAQSDLVNSNSHVQYIASENYLIFISGNNVDTISSKMTEISGSVGEKILAFEGKIVLIENENLNLIWDRYQKEFKTSLAIDNKAITKDDLSFVFTELTFYVLICSVVGLILIGFIILINRLIKKLKNK